MHGSVEWAQVAARLGQRGLDARLECVGAGKHHLSLVGEVVEE
jgi:hypothetical protein